MRHRQIHHVFRSLACALGIAALVALMAAAPAPASASCPGDGVVQSAAASLTQAVSSGSPQAFATAVQRGNGDPAALIDYLRSGRSFE